MLWVYHFPRRPSNCHVPFNSAALRSSLARLQVESQGTECALFDLCREIGVRVAFDEVSMVLRQG